MTFWFQLLFATVVFNIQSTTGRMLSSALYVTKYSKQQDEMLAAPSFETTLLKGNRTVSVK